MLRLDFSSLSLSLSSSKATTSTTTTVTTDFSTSALKHDNILVFYGAKNCYRNVTDDVAQKCCRQTDKNIVVVILPKGDLERGRLFGDHVPNVDKHLLVIYKDQMHTYLSSETVELCVSGINTTLKPADIVQMHPGLRLAMAHSKLKLETGTWYDELPEQLLVMQYVHPEAKVLEIGSNIGRNSLIIATVLGPHAKDNFVTMECDPKSVYWVTKHRQLNGLQFHIEPRALSSKPLMMQGWDTHPLEYESDGQVKTGYKEVLTITWPELQNKYKIAFDTLVLDCEGAFYHILLDMPQILDGIRLIILENDFWRFPEKEHVDQTLTKAGFQCIYSQEGGKGPCFEFFYQVWQKTPKIVV